MKSLKLYSFFLIVWVSSLFNQVAAQSNNPAPYPGVTYAMVPCNQNGPSQSTGNFINDFIHSFNTTGGIVNISNNNSGCCGLPNNYIYYGCNHILAVNPGQTITCNIQSGIIFPQGFALWVDWNQDNQFATPAERIGTAPVMTPAGTWTTMTFVVPLNQPNGTYRMRVRCVYATGGNNIVPSSDLTGQTPIYTYGETEDYNLYVGIIPNTIITATASSPQPTLCAGQTITLTALNSATAPTYTWTGPGSFSSNAASPIIPNASLANSGTYTVIVSNGACPVSKTVAISVVPLPTISLVPAMLTTCQGGSVTAQVQVIGANSNFSFSWLGQGNIWTPGLPTTLIFPPALNPNVLTSNFHYTVSVTPAAASCPVTKILTVTVNNPPVPTFNIHPPLCNTSAIIQLSATPGGGTWSANPAVQPNGIFNPALAAIGTNTVTYTAGVGNCLVANKTTVDVSKFHTAALTSTPGMRCSKDAGFYLMNIVQDTTTGWWTGPHVNSNNYFISAGVPTGNYTLKYFSPSAPDSSVCPDSVFITIPVFNPPIPVIAPIAPKCHISPQVSLTATPVGGLWSGNSGVTPLGVQTPSSNQIGINTVTYTAGQGTCTSSSSRTFEVSQFRTATLTAGIPDLCYNSNPINLMNLALNNSGAWSGQNVNSSFYFNPTGLSTNTYVLKYKTTSTPNAALCPDSSYVTVSVLNPPHPNISAVGPVCSKDAAFQLTVTPALGNWSPTSYLSPGGLFTPSLSAAGSNVVEYVIGTNTCNAKQSIFINVESFVPATILYNIPDQCDNGPAISLVPFTANSLGNWSGPGIMASSFYPGQTGAGTFTLTYNTASSPSGLCPDKSVLSVNVYSLAPPDITQAGPFCTSSLPVKLIASPTGGIFNGNGLNGVSSEGLFNPAVAQLGSNILTYSVQVGPCIAHAQTTVHVQQFISADIAKQPEAMYCRTAESFNLNSLVQNPGGIWEGPGVTGTQFDPKKANIGKNVLYYHTVSAPIATLCSDSKSVEINIKDLPKVTVQSNLFKGCAPMEINFSSPENLPGTSYWTISDGSGKLNGSNITYTFTKAGEFDVVYNYNDDQAVGCSTQVKLSNKIEIYPLPHAAFSTYPEEVTVSDPEIRITNLSTPLGDNRYWWVVEGVNLYDDVHPVVHFPQAGNYKIKLKATNIHGCYSEASKIVVVKNEFNVYIPNSFTPNFDGMNDFFLPVFSPYGLSADTYLMEIFDRWGHLIFNSKDHRKGWDGTYNNKGDEILKEDSYTYRIRYKDLEGNSYTKMGTVVLLK